MAYSFTSRFDTLSEAESAATKLKSIRAQEVEISPWSSGADEDPFSGTGFAGFPAPTGLAFPAFGAMGGSVSNGTSGGGFALMAVAGTDEQFGGQGYLLHAVVEDSQQEQGQRIVRECGGKQI